MRNVNYEEKVEESHGIHSSKIYSNTGYADRVQSKLDTIIMDYTCTNERNHNNMLHLAQIIQKIQGPLQELDALKETPKSYQQVGTIPQVMVLNEQHEKTVEYISHMLNMLDELI